MRVRAEHDPVDARLAGQGHLDPRAEHALGLGIADHGQPLAGNPRLAQQLGRAAGERRADDHVARGDLQRARRIGIGKAAGEHPAQRVIPLEHGVQAAARPSQAATTASSRARRVPACGESEPSKIAEPMVKASAPAARRASMRSKELTLPATMSSPRWPMALRAARTSSSGSAAVAR
eukprot:Opistho-1_new@48142